MLTFVKKKKKKHRQKWVMFWNIIRKKKSALCFTCLFKIQISNYLYIKLHMRTSIYCCYLWMKLWHKSHHGNDWLIRFGCRLCNRRTTTNNITPCGCSASWFKGGSTRPCYRGLTPSTGHCSALTPDQPPGLSSLLFQTLFLPHWPALCASFWWSTGELKVLSIQRWSYGECQEQQDMTF